MRNNHNEIKEEENVDEYMDLLPKEVESIITDDYFEPQEITQLVARQPRDSMFAKLNLKHLIGTLVMRGYIPEARFALRQNPMAHFETHKTVGFWQGQEPTIEMPLGLPQREFEDTPLRLALGNNDPAMCQMLKEEMKLALQQIKKTDPALASQLLAEFSPEAQYARRFTEIPEEKDENKAWLAKDLLALEAAAAAITQNRDTLWKSQLAIDDFKKQLNKKRVITHGKNFEEALALRALDIIKINCIDNNNWDEKQYDLFCTKVYGHIESLFTTVLAYVTGFGIYDGVVDDQDVVKEPPRSYELRSRDKAGKPVMYFEFGAPNSGLGCDFCVNGIGYADDMLVLRHHLYFFGTDVVGIYCRAQSSAVYEIMHKPFQIDDVHAELEQHGRRGRVVAGPESDVVESCCLVM